MELKHAFPIVDNIRAPCLNRTFVELKLNLERLVGVEQRRLNRTFVELKPHSALYRCPRVVVLIEPLWN